MKFTNEAQVEKMFAAMFNGESDDVMDQIVEVQTFLDAGVMTMNHGLVFRMAGGMEVQMTMVMSRRPMVVDLDEEAEWDGDDDNDDLPDPLDPVDYEDSDRMAYRSELIELMAREF